MEMAHDGVWVGPIAAQHGSLISRMFEKGVLEGVDVVALGGLVERVMRRRTCTLLSDLKRHVGELRMS
jgi:hypothetical protein